MIKPIETTYAGCRFRSRLEARWAVFFDELGIEWQYEPQGFDFDGRRYLPDFYLPTCGTWVEVKGEEAKLDRELMVAAASLLPRELNGGEPGPALLILGPIPRPATTRETWAWVGLSAVDLDRLDQYEALVTTDGHVAQVDRWILDNFTKNYRPWWVDAWETADSFESWTKPVLVEEVGRPDVYATASSARFEHGQTPVPVGDIDPRTGGRRLC